LAKDVHVRKGDTVYVLSGKDKGKKGKILAVIPDDSMVLVEGVNMATKHKKPKSRYQQGGIIHQESPISSSKVMLVCNKCKAPTKIKKEVHADGQKDRVCKRCGELIDILKESKED
jgi:large subunit ribosomal protein L24